MAETYIEEFSSNEDIIDRYNAPADTFTDATVHLAWYGYGDYCGSSIVIFEKDGKLYEVNGSHCSCMGLEGQWQPEETSWEAIAMRKHYGSGCEGNVEAMKRIKELVKAHVLVHAK